MAVSLDIPRNRNRFLRIIQDASHTNRISGWEECFLSDMKKKFDEREEFGHITGTVWNPSVSQWNTLTDIERKL